MHKIICGVRSRITNSQSKCVVWFELLVYKALEKVRKRQPLVDIPARVNDLHGNASCVVSLSSQPPHLALACARSTALQRLLAPEPFEKKASSQGLSSVCTLSGTLSRLKALKVCSVVSAQQAHSPAVVA